VRIAAVVRAVAVVLDTDTGIGRAAA